MTDLDLILLFSADSDIQAGFNACEEQQSGRGEIFMRHLDATFARIRRFPESAPVFHPPFRRVLVPSFPYGVFYAIEGKRLVVVGVMDLRQNPESIQRRLRSEAD